MTNRKIRHRHLKIFCLALFVPFLLFSVLFLLILGVGYVRRTYINPPFLTINDIKVFNDGAEFRVLPLPDTVPYSGPADIYLYGDSWTGGFGVPQGYSFSDLIRNHFKATCTVAIAGKNGGDLTRQYIDIKRAQYTPRLSLIFFNLNNDYETSMMESPYGFGMDYVLLGAGDKAVSIHPRDESLQGKFRYTRDFSHMDRYPPQTSFFGESLNNLLYRLGLKEQFLHYTFYLTEYFYSTDGGWKYVKRPGDPKLAQCAERGYRLLDVLFREINALLQGRLVVILLSPRESFGMDIFRRMYDVAAASTGIAHENLDYNQPRAKVIAMLQEQGISYLDTYPAMEQAILDGKDLFIDNNSHPNWLGHRIIYDAVIQDIERFLAKHP